MVRPTRIATLGNAFLDRILYVTSLPSGAGKMRVLRQIESGGGIAATAACTAARLSASTLCYSRLGDDAAGNEVIRRLKSFGVETEGILRAAQGRSPQGTIIVDPEGERVGLGFMGEGWTDDPTWLDFRLLDGVNGVMADYSWWKGAAAIFAAARDRGAVTVLDADVNDLDAVRRLLPLADHVVFSERCLSGLTGHAEPESGLQAIADQVRQHVSVTCGAKGFYWLEDGCVRHIPAFKVVPVDTNGAGDVFHGAYTVAVAEGQSVEAAGRFASAAAALKCRKGSGWESIPNRDEVEVFLTGENR